MKERFRDFPLTVDEVRRIMRKEESRRATWCAIGISVIAILVGLIIWIAKKRDKDLSEHYEYFDDDFDELDDDFDELDDDFEEFDDSIYEDESDEEGHIEYVKIKDFIDDEEVASEDKDTDEKADASSEESSSKETLGKTEA